MPKFIGHYETRAEFDEMRTVAHPIHAFKETISTTPTAQLCSSVSSSSGNTKKLWTRYVVTWTFLFIILAGACSGVVLKASSDFATIERSKAQLVASSVAANFQALLIGSLFSMQTMSSFIEDGPRPPIHSAVIPFFENVAPRLTASTHSIYAIQLAPYGVVAAIHPIINSFGDSTRLFSAGGLNLFDSESPIVNRRKSSVFNLKTRKVYMEGPMQLFGNSLQGQENRAIVGHYPLFVETQNQSDSWGDAPWPAPSGLPPLGPFHHVHNCSGLLYPETRRSLCATNATGDNRRFWGFYNVIVLWNVIIEEAQVQSLSEQGYDWSIWRSSENTDGTGDFTWDLADSYGGVPVSPTEKRNSAVIALASVETSTWAFVVSKAWSPPWMQGLIVGVIICSAALASLVLLIISQFNSSRYFIHELRAGREADSVLNHTLKNSVYGAVCVLEIEQQRELSSPTSPERAAGINAAIDQLHRTILWCSGRQVLIDVTTGSYQSSLSPIKLRTFLSSVASTLTTHGHTIGQWTEDLFVAVDEKMCRIALDNALTNAAIHGGTDDIVLGAKFHPQGK